VDKTLALTWQLTEIHGWGLVGVHTALYLCDVGRPPLLLEKPAFSTLRPENAAKLKGLEAGYLELAQLAEQNKGHILQIKGTSALHALGNGFLAGPPSMRFRGESNVGVVAFENTLLDEAVMRRVRAYDRIVVHSTFNETLLKDRGYDNVGLAFQGIDPREMCPCPPTGRFGGRFAIFSGGKLEFRKAQDVVLAAFRIFHQRHPDALLVTAWHNAWPDTAMSIMESPHVSVAPEIGADSKLKLTEWAAANGVPADAFVDVGFLKRAQIAPLLADCQAAVFPNRCEGATNLVAMEAMACGVPVVLSANTGHLDLIRPGNSLALTRQTPMANDTGARTGWMESSIDEMVEHLETLYTDRAAAVVQAVKASTFITGERTWRAFAEAFVVACRC
jgi:glycosyltransferase involved in cell wall biosynthesis